MRDKGLNKNRKFNLKAMAKQSNITSIANKFAEDFNEFVKALKNESGYDGENYKDLLEEGKLTSKGKEIKKECTVIVIEHDMDFVKQIANQVTVLHEGKILKEGCVAEVLSDSTVQKVYLGRGGE